MQKTFYKIVDNKAQVGSGTFVPEDFIEYEIGNEPLELVEVLERETEELRYQNVIDSYNKYLRETDWIKSYLLEHKLGISIIPEDSSKWLIINTRQSYIDFLKGL